MRYEIVDKVQTFKDYLDGKVKNEEIEVVNFDQSTIWAMSELMAADVLNKEIIFIRKHTK